MLAVCIGVISVFAQDEPKKPLEDQSQEQQDKQLPGQEQGKEEVTSVTGTVYGVRDEQGQIKSVEIRDDQGKSFSIHTEGRGKDLLRLVDAKITARGRMMGGEAGAEVGDKQTFHVESYEATLGIAGKLIEREENQLVLEEISFQETPRSFKVLNTKEEVEKLGIPFDKEVKATGTISVEGFNGSAPREESMPREGSMPQEGSKPEEGVKPEEGKLPQDDKAAHERQFGMDAQREGLWTMRLNSYEPLEYIVGVVNLEKGEAADMQIRLEEEEKGIIFKEKGRTFEVSNMGKGPELRICEGAKIKAYGTLSKNQQGNWLLHVLAYQKEGQEEKREENKNYEEGAPDKKE
jgi:hypothetical protein